MAIKYNKEFGKVVNSVKIELLEAGISDLDHRWQKEDVCSPFSRLYYIISGEGYLRIHGKEDEQTKVHVLRPGRMVLIPNGLSYDYFCKDSLTKIHFHLNIQLQNSLDLFYGCKDYYELPVEPSVLNNMKEWILSERSEDYFHMLGAIYHAIAAFSFAAELADKVTQTYSDMTSRLFAVLAAPKMNASIGEIARQLHVSESTLAKNFKKETGLSIGRYREQLIMNRARLLLAMGEKRIGEIAEELGFSEQFYFCKYFKQRQGITPSAYKQFYSTALKPLR